MWLSVTALPVAQTLRADCQRQLTKNTICTLPSLTKEDCLYFHSSTGLRLSYFCFVTFFYSTSCAIFERTLHYYHVVFIATFANFRV